MTGRDALEHRARENKASGLRKISAVLKPFAFDTIDGHSFDRVIPTGAEAAMEASVERDLNAIREGRQDRRSPQRILGRRQT